MSKNQASPLVVIVGRPNVGKSTLFNRYARSRRALVGDTPGVTRDRIFERIEVLGRSVLLVDTAGLELKSSGGLESAIQAQAQCAVDEADAILFVADGAAGLLPADEAIAKILRRSGKPMILAVNKIDVPAHQRFLSDFHQLGFSNMMAVSAEHGSGAFDCLDALVAEIPPPEAGGPDSRNEDDIRVALVGRPNVGKSSLANKLLGEERVVVSSVPGTTRDAIDIRLEANGHGFVLVDTAGLRRPGKRRLQIERGSALMTVRSLESAQVALLLIDASEGITDQDAAVANLVRERGCAVIVVANKWDLVPGDEAKGLLEDIRHGLRFVSDASLVTVSAKSGLHLGKLLPQVRRAFDAASRRIPTGELNRWLEETVARHEPSMARRGHSRRPIKFFYGTQTGVHPPTFVLFCTEPQAILPSYRRFLENQLRARFGFAGTPVRLRLRARNEKPGAERGERGRKRKSR